MYEPLDPVVETKSMIEDVVYWSCMLELLILSSCLNIN